MRAADRSRAWRPRAVPLSSLLPAAVDQFDSVLVGIAHEADERAALAHAIRLTLRLDALLLQLRERLRQVVHGVRNVPVAGPDLVRAAVVVVRELQLLFLAGDAEEVVRRLRLAAADDVHVTAELEPERLVERAALHRIGDPDHGVQVSRHARSLAAGDRLMPGPRDPHAAARRARRPAIRRSSGTPCASRPPARTRCALRARSHAR